MAESGAADDPSRFTPENERRMALVARVLETMGPRTERGTQLGVDYYEISPVGSDEYPIWIVARQPDGIYQRLSGTFGVIAQAATLEKVLFPGWLALSSYVAFLPPDSRR